MTTSPRRYALAVLGNFYDVVSDIARSRALSRQNFLDQIASIDGDSAYHATRSGGGGAIVLTAHAGSFEVGLAALSELEPHIHVVFKRDPFPLFEQSRQALRNLVGVIESPVDDGPGIWMTLRDALCANHVVALQGDRTPPGQKAMAMRVLGGTLLLPTGPFKLALASRTVVIPIFSVRLPDGKVSIFIRPAIHVADAAGIEPAVRQYAAELEWFLGRYPEQWLILEPAFTPPMF